MATMLLHIRANTKQQRRKSKLVLTSFRSSSVEMPKQKISLEQRGEGKWYQRTWTIPVINID